MASVVIIYWFENVIIGTTTILKMLFSRDEGVANAAGRNALKIFMIPFFIVHYGGFCFVHGMFVMVLTAEWKGGTRAEVFDQTLSTEFLIGIIILLASHLISFFVNYLAKQEFRRADFMQMMVSPYKRIFLLQVVIIFGGWIVIISGENSAILALLVVGKILLDIKAHKKERLNFQPSA